MSLSGVIDVVAGVAVAAVACAVDAEPLAGAAGPVPGRRGRRPIGAARAGAAGVVVDEEMVLGPDQLVLACLPLVRLFLI